MMKHAGFVCWVAFILVVVGGLNWGLVGFFGFNLVDAIFGMGSVVSRVIYALVGLAAVYAIFSACCCKDRCGSGQ